MKLLIFSFLLFCQLAMSAQVITEIMYNPPESGTDSLEYIEIYNGSTAAIDLMGFRTIGVSHEFTSTLIMAPEEYVVLCKDSIALFNVFGINAYQWDGGALSNGGEEVSLMNANGDMISYVAYGTNAPWPDTADGDGSSIEFCDRTGDILLPENWAASTNEFMLADSSLIYGTPLAENTCDVGISAIDDVDFDSLVHISPNPTNTVIRIESELPFDHIQIFDQLGRTVLENANTSIVSMAHLPNGSYFVKIQVGESYVVKRVAKI